MSNTARWSYQNAVVTVWPVTVSEFGGESYGSPYLIQCDYAVGGEIAMSDAGDQFVSKSKYFFEAYHGDPIIPKMSWKAALGDHTASAVPVDSAERIMSVNVWGNPLDDSAPDRVFYT